jgi:threonylcarbamoyladenosine tRNA methylthiotransferase MtaB
VARFYIENFGCRATQADGAALERQFLDRGMERALGVRDAEIVVLNTCTVTEGADKDARASIRRLQRVNPACRILVTGCYAQRAPKELAALPGVTWVVGNSHKHQVAEIATAKAKVEDFVPIEKLSRGPMLERAKMATAPPVFPDKRKESDSGAEIVIGDIFAHTELMAAPVFESANARTRPNLKVQDGCDNRCSFCVIPYVRGQSRSLPADRVVAEVRNLVKSGYREVVISGINLGRWGRDLPAAGCQPSVLNHRANPVASQQSLTVGDPAGSMGTEIGTGDEPTTLNSRGRASNERRLVDLIHAILDRTTLEKLRISSVEPMDWTDELIALMASSGRIAKHAHVPMQSGSDSVLRRMHRKYHPWNYREKIAKIRRAMPSAAIGADVMVGFPGEREAEFQETRAMVEELPFTYLHVFTYSARPGTPAAEHAGQVDVGMARKRNGILREIASAKKAAFLGTLVGTEVEAITLCSGGDDFTEALTDNYLKIRIPRRVESNRWVRLRVESAAGDQLLAQSP